MFLDFIITIEIISQSRISWGFENSQTIFSRLFFFSFMCVQNAYRGQKGVLNPLELK